MRDHTPVVIDSFNGLWELGDPENTPIDHFSDGENFQFKGKSTGVKTRDGIDKHQNVVAPIGNVVRIYNYITQSKNTLLALTYDGTTGKIYHVVDSTTIFGPILTIAGMSDFAFVPNAGRAYISPFSSFVINNLNVEKGLSGQFVYVYLGDGTAARKAAGTPASGTLTIVNGAAGHTDAGFHLFAVVGETDTGYQSPPIAFAGFTTSANLSVSFSNIPVFTGAQWIKRHIVATIVIQNYNGNTTGYTYFFIPGATVPNNVATTLSNISFFDADLLDDASHLLDNFAEIPAGAVLNIYHNRLLVATTFNDISLVLVSEEGEPEAINQISGLLIVPLDGNPITNAQEMRDVLYVFKRNRIVSYVDNGDVPSTWATPTPIDLGIGAAPHGIAQVLDSGGVNIEYLIVAHFGGLYVFSGTYIKPELTWKIEDLWLDIDKSDFVFLSIMNDTINKRIYIGLPNRRMLMGDYKNGLDYEKIRWHPWTFDIEVTAIALLNTNELVIGAQRES